MHRDVGNETIRELVWADLNINQKSCDIREKSQDVELLTKIHLMNDISVNHFLI